MNYDDWKLETPEDEQARRHRRLIGKYWTRPDGRNRRCKTWSKWLSTSRPDASS